MMLHWQPIRRCNWLLAMFCLFMAGLSIAPLPAQVVEEEEPVKRKPRVIPVDDDAVPRPARDITLDDMDLPTAARQAKNPTARKLYDDLKVPRDRLVQRSRTDMIEPVAQYIGNDPKRAPARLHIIVVDPRDGTSRGALDVPVGAIKQLDAYEELALVRVDDFLEEIAKAKVSGEAVVTRAEGLRHAVIVLGAVLRYHEAARRSRQRDGDEWNPVESALRNRLLALQLERVSLLWEGKKYSEGAELARRSAERYGRPDEIATTGRQLAQSLDKIYQGDRTDDQAREILRVIGELERYLPPGKADELSRPIHDRFRRQAEQRFQRAKVLVGERKPQEAQAELEAALKLCPQLPGLQDYLLEQQNAYPILKVGVRELPRNFLPGLAWTDSERQAAELLFESLVRPTHDAQGEQFYSPGLSLSRPRTLTLARQFELPRDGRWSNDQPIDFEDVRNTLTLLREPRWPGYRPSLDKMIRDVERGSETGQVVVSLSQGFIDPLALMNFKILPRDLKRADKVDFNTHPRGTGPYVLAETGNKGKREVLRFKTNPGFAGRAGKRGQPFFREIHFVVSNDPAHDLADGAIDMCLDVPSSSLQSVLVQPETRLLPTAPNRRVYFLAINHRYGSALPNSDFRTALAAAIDREALLSCFRPAKGTAPGMPAEFHQALSGLFPAGSWASVPKPEGQRRDLLHDARTVKDGLAQVEKTGIRKVNLTLKYPSDDPRVAEAMKLLCKQVQEAVAAAHTTIELEIQPVAVDPHDLREDVEEKFDYELAFYHHDFDTDLCWAWPLFDPDPRAREPGGGNYLGYHNDAQLEALFGQAMKHRDFQEVQNATRAIAELLEKRLPIIPLWQLDRHVVAKKELKIPGTIDPVLVLSGVEEWNR